MKNKTKWLKALYLLGVIALVFGAIDPLEGSVVVLAGSLCLAISTYLLQDRYWKSFLILLLLIAIGVIAMFVLSQFSDVVNQSDKSRWWLALILPYPIGWLISVILLAVKVFLKVSENKTDTTI